MPILTADSFSGFLGCESNGNMVQFRSSTGQFTIDNPNMKVYGIKLNYDQVRTRFQVKVLYSDQNFSQSDVDGGQWTVDPSVSASAYIRFITAGKCSKITLSVTGISPGASINSIQINKPYFHFNRLRFLCLFFVLFILYMIKKKQLWAKQFYPDSLWHYATLYSVFFAAAGIGLILVVGSGYANTPIFHDLGSTNDCYTLLTQALSSGHLHYLVKPSQGLLSLSDPYDISLRVKYNIDYLWDSALFNGKYYCYFGITPVLTLLLPFRMLTGFYLSTSLACFIYFLPCIAASLALYNEIVKKWYPSIGALPFTFGAFLVAFGNNLFWLVARPMFYELALISALTYTFLSFYMLIRALNKKHVLLKLAASGLFFSLMVASRPNFIIYMVVAVPFLCKIIFNDTRKKINIQNLLAFALPLTIFALMIMCYNDLRFGSPFDFGQKYQLTVSDIKYNKVTNIAVIPEGIFRFYFQPLKIDLTYPFFHIQPVILDTSSGFFYNQFIAGLVNYPVLLILPAAVFIFKRCGHDRRVMKTFTFLLIVSAFIISIVDILGGGAHERYTLDIHPFFNLAAIILWFECYNYFKSKGIFQWFARLFCIAALVTVLISTLSSSTGEYENQKINNPIFFERLSNAIEFWR